MDSASLRDFRGGEGAYVADALERSLLLPANMAELGCLRRQEVFLSIKRYLGMVRLPTLVPYSPCACFNWQAVQATYRLEEAANDQSKALEQERDKRLEDRKSVV